MRHIRRGVASALGIAVMLMMSLGAQDARKRDDQHASKTKELTVAKAVKGDAKAIARQKTCPVSGEDLGSMGTPVKVTRGEDSVFLCCPACVKKVKADPEKYLNAISVAKATKADEKAVARQKTCPVSGEELHSMGTPVKITRGESSVFLCCEACVKEVRADPEKYLGRTDSPAKKDDSKNKPSR